MRAMAMLLAVLVGAMTWMTAPARAQPAGPPRLYEAPLPALTDRPTRELADGVRMFGDVIYVARPGYRPLMLDLYVPPHAATSRPLPLVVWVHGGGYELGNPRADWTYGDWSVQLARLAARGYIVAGVAYRFKREAPYPAQYDDVRAAVGFLRDHAARWNIDARRIYAWGLSAGGHVVSMLGMKSPTDDPKYRVQGIVDWFGPADFNALRDRPGAAQSQSTLLGCEGVCSEQRFAAASPVDHVTAAAPPVMIVQGEADQLVPVAQSDEFAATLKAAHVPVTYRRLPGLGHGFEGGSNAQQEEILQDTWRFLDRLAGK